MKRYIYSILMICVFGTLANAQSAMQQLADGTKYTIFTTDTGPKIQVNDVITFNIIQKTDKDSVLASSYSAAQPAKMQVVAPETVNDIVQKRVMEVLAFASLNDSLLIKIPTDSLLKGNEDKRPSFFPKGSYFNLYFKIMKIQALNDAIAERNAEIAKIAADEVIAENKYAIDNKLIVTTTSSGLKYTITKAGLKPKPQTGDTVYVNYTGKLLNGKVFDSSIQANAVKAGLNQPGRTYEPISVIIGEHHIIQGWEEGLLLLNEGSKATFIIPSSLGYGEQGMGDIPPFSPLVFDLEITSVKRAKHAPLVPKPNSNPPPVKSIPKKHTTKNQ
jgi:FKBP-type peptidyl-prolyl cis-trans isomerase